ncbi:MAG: hypothetical protein WBD47_03875 [Phormidesmis sp.]
MKIGVAKVRLSLAHWILRQSSGSAVGMVLVTPADGAENKIEF